MKHTEETATSTDTAPTTDQEIIAPLWKRLIAMLYDSFLVLALSMGYGAIVTAIDAGQQESLTKDYSPSVEGLAFQLGWLATILIFLLFSFGSEQAKRLG